MFKKRKSKVVFENSRMQFLEDIIEYEDGIKGTYNYLKRKNGVMVIVTNQKKEILLVEQFRYPIQQQVWSLPGGAIEINENPREAAIREVKEEAGLDIIQLLDVATFFPLGSGSTEKAIVFAAKSTDEITQLKTHLSDESIQEKKFFSLEEIFTMLDSNQIKDSTTVAVLLTFARKIKKFRNLI